MSDQSVQAAVSSVKTALQIFKGLIDFVKDSKKKDAEELKNKLDAKEKEGKTKDDEYKKMKNKLDSYEKANLDFDNLSKNTDTFMKKIDTDTGFQESLGKQYKKNLVDSLKKAGIKPEEVEDYIKGSKDFDSEKKSKIEKCRQDAILKTAEEVSEDKLGFKLPVSSIAKDKSAFQKDIEKAITKSKELGNLANKEDLGKIKKDLEPGLGG